MTTRSSKSSKRAGQRKAAPSIIVGWREWVGLPDIGDFRVKAKIDTGARTSAIHAWKIKPFEKDGEAWVRFELHPNQDDNTTRIPCEMPVLESRNIRSSNGQVQTRYVVATRLSIGPYAWPIELTLTRRDEMGFRMLIGRTALRPAALVDPTRSFLCSAPL